MRYIFTMILSGVVTWMTSPIYLASTPSDVAVIVKAGAFLLLWFVLSIIVRKKGKES